MKRIAVGQILQETNTLNPHETQGADFEVYGLAHGAEVMGRYGDVGELAGFASLSEVLEEDVEWVGLVRAVAWSNGPVAGPVLDELVEDAVGPLRGAAVDGVIFSLHGAQSATTDFDVSGRVLWAMRQAVGADVPIVATLDLHANITRRMVQCADVLVGYHTMPHIDHIRCGQRAARALAGILQAGRRPRVSAWKMPMLANSDGRNTDRGVMVDLWRRIHGAEERDDVYAAALFPVQPWFDVAELGWTLYQAYSGEEPPLDPRQIARACWQTRAYKGTAFLKPEQVVPAALGIEGGPVAVSESHDATNSGAPGDSTLLLGAFSSGEIPGGGALMFCVDGESVARCFDVGAGSQVELEVGGKIDPYSEPLLLSVEVADLGDLKFVLSGHGGHNLPVDMGRRATVQVGDVTLVLVEKTGPGSSPQLYEAAGLDPRAFKIVAAKSPEGFRQDYEPFSSGILYCGAPGCATPFLDQVDFRQVSRPLYPFDDIEDMASVSWAGEMAKGER